MNGSYEINGEEIDSLSGFYDYIGNLLLPGEFWGKNLDALNDILRGGFNLPKSPFEIIWTRTDISKKILGLPATIEWHKNKIARFSDDSENLKYYTSKLKELESGNGKTLFDVLVDILSENSKSVEYNEDNIIFKM